MMKEGAGDSSSASLHPPVRGPLGDVETERLRLSRLQAADLDELVRVFAKPEVWEFPLGRGLTRGETEGFLERQMELWSTSGFGLWLAADRTTGRAIGFVGLSVPRFMPAILPAVEVGWRLDPAFWGRGYATEGASAALDQAFGTLGLETVCSLPQTANPRSMRVAERLGMKPERPVEIPGTEARGPVEVTPFWLTGDEWRVTRREGSGQPEGE
jgi:RimJ/RimL family protein N-acetyltransferase